MEREEAERTLETLRRELAEAKEAVGAAMKRMSALRKLIEGYEELFPELTDTVLQPATLDAADHARLLDGRPRGQEAVRQVMKESVGKWWTVTSLVKELQTRGWLPESEVPSSAVRTAVERLVVTDPNVHKDKGSTGAVTYSFRPFVAPHPVESNGSDKEVHSS